MPKVNTFSRIRSCPLPVFQKCSDIFLLVDEDTASREITKKLLREFNPDASVYEALNIEMARSLISKYKPTVIFITLTLSKESDILYKTVDKGLEIIFIAENCEFASRAFAKGATDFLLKPLKKKQFDSALKKTFERKKSEISIREYLLNSESRTVLQNILIIPQFSKIAALSYEEIIYFEADNSYTSIYYTQGSKILTSKRIKLYEKDLNSHWFFRIHRSYIINLLHFKEYSSNKGNCVIMANGQRLPISRYKLAKFFKKIRFVSLR